jgi:hypothetical protein
MRRILGLMGFVLACLSSSVRLSGEAHEIFPYGERKASPPR